MSNNYDDDVFVNLVARKQRSSVRDNTERNSKVISYDENNFGVDDEYIPEISENSSRSNNGIKKDNILKKIVGKVAMLLAVTTITQSAMCYIDGARKVTRRVYDDIVAGGMVFKTDEDGNTYVAYGSDNMGLTAWQDVTVEDYKNAKEIAKISGHSVEDIYTSFDGLNFKDFKDAFSNEEKPNVENIAHYIELGWNSRFEGRGR